MQSEPVKILRKLQAFGYKSAIIAGGAIRDDFTKQDITDYDIFLWDPRLSEEFKHPLSLNKMDFASPSFEMDRTTEFVDILQTLDLQQIFNNDGCYGPLTCVDGDPIDTPGIGAKLTSIWEAEFDYNSYQLIYTQINPVEHVNHYFDIGLCKAYCDGTKLRYTPDFMRDLKNRTFTIVGEDMTYPQFAYALDYHVNKLWEKYPSFKIEFAPHNSHHFETYKSKKP